MARYEKVLFVLLLGISITLFVLGVKNHNETKDRTDLPAIVPGLNSQEKLPPVIRLHDKDSKDFFCSGSVISKNYAVTAAHCVAGRSKRTPSIEVRDINNEKKITDATPVFYNERSDLALLLGDFSAANQMVATDDPETVLKILSDNSRMVVACGFPYGGSFFCSPLENRGQYYFSIGGRGFLYPGMSGGPVMDYATMTLVGVNTAAAEGGVIISPLIELLSDAGVRKAP